MFNKKIIFSVLLVLFSSSLFVCAQTTNAPAAVKQIQTIKADPIKEISSLQLVANPSLYLDKQVSMNVKFDKFSTLGLDYKKALRDSQKYIGFLVQRDDVKDHNVPLSELKLFITRDYAEKFIDLNTGDKIKISGKVFSNALGDPWVDINSIEIIEKAPDNKAK